MHRRHRTITRIRGRMARDPRFVSELDPTGPASRGSDDRPSRRAAGLMQVVAVVLAALLLWAWAPHSAEAFHKFPKWKCGYHWEKGKWHRKQLIKCQAARKGLRGPKAISRADCESHL